MVLQIAPIHIPDNPEANYEYVSVAWLVPPFLMTSAFIFGAFSEQWNVKQKLLCVKPRTEVETRKCPVNIVEQGLNN
jgi:hypothetical protein